MSILDQLLGGSDQESANMNSEGQNFDFATNPNFGFHASDVLHSSSHEEDDGDSESSEFTGIGDIGLDLAAPTVIGVSSSSDSSSWQETDGDSGGLLGGLL